jgi:hypothetical protein
MLLEKQPRWTLDKLQAAAYDSYQPGLAVMVPTLIAAFDRLPQNSPQRRRLADPIAQLRGMGLSLGRCLGAQHAGRLLGRAADAIHRLAPGRPAGTSSPNGLAAEVSDADKLAAFTAILDGWKRTSAAGAPPGARSTASSA